MPQSVLPSVSLSTDDALATAADALVVPVFRGGIEGPGADEALRALGLDHVPRDAGFTGRVGQTLTLAAPRLAARRVVLVGLGRMDELDDEQVRRAAGSATRLLAEGCRHVVTTLPLVNVAASTVRAAAEGAVLGAYRYLAQRSEPPPVRLREVTLVVPSGLQDAAASAVRLAEVHAGAQSDARDLVNTPPAELGPDELVERAKSLCPHLDIEVWDERRLADERCGGVLAVGQGSSRPPRMLLLRHRPAAADPIATVALVGKGIVFDAGGLSLKRDSAHMATMKYDMAGVAAVVAAMSALPQLDLPVAVLGVCPLAENLPSGAAQRPGDVLTARNGTTVEVLDTDAEGRLVLADGLAYAAEQDVDAIVDVATLTGDAVRAVGARAIAAFANDDDLLRQVLLAADGAGEAAWRLPLWDDLRANLDSDVADLDNLGRGDEAGATMAALFLREFVGGRPWVHLDVAGPAWTKEHRHHLVKGATGTPVRTLLRWLEQTAA